MGQVEEFLGETGGFDEIKPGSKNPYLETGVHRLKINRCVFTKFNPKKGGGFYFVAEFKILESTNAAHPVGSSASFFLNFKDYVDMRKRQLLEFVMKGFDMTEAESKQAIASGVIWNEKQILAGEEVKVVVRDAENPKTGSKFKEYQWIPVA